MPRVGASGPPRGCGGLKCVEEEEEEEAGCGGREELVCLGVALDASTPAMLRRDL